MESWVDQRVLDRIFIDEVHTVFSEIRFRSFKVLEWLPSLGIPIIALRGTLPLFALSRLTKKLCLSQDKNSSNCHIIYHEKIYRSFPDGFEILIEMQSDFIAKTVEFVIKTLCQAPCQGVIHVFADVKENAKTIFNNLFQQFNFQNVSAESTQQEQLKIAEEWSKVLSGY